MKLIKIIIFSALFLFDYFESTGADTTYICPPVGDEVPAKYYPIFINGDTTGKFHSWFNGTCDSLEPSSGNYDCHGYAWYISEGNNNGRDWIQNCQENDEDCIKLIMFLEDGRQRFIQDYNCSDFCVSYMQIYPPGHQYYDSLYFSLREKVYYNVGSEAHSAIIFQKDTSSPIDPMKDYFISKWNMDGPLVKHYPDSCPHWDTNDDLSQLWYYQKKLMRVDGEIASGDTRNCSIGEQMKSSGYIDPNKTVKFIVGRLDKSMIRLEPGFKAKRGCTFHAYTKECLSYGSSYNCRDEPARHAKTFPSRQENVFTKKDKNDNCLNIFPNPATGMTAVFLNSPVKGNAIITIFDAMGSRALMKQKNKGTNTLEWQFESKGLQGGVYFCRVTVDGKVVGETKFIVSH